MSAPRNRPAPMQTTVRRVSRISPSLVRVVLGGDELARFADPVEADSYVKLVFPHADGDRRRTYTVRAFDRAQLELTIDVVVHGTAGVAGPWAAAARPGDVALVQGPGGGYSPDPDAAWHLLVGDASALPAIAVALERMPAGRTVHAFLEVEGPADELALAAPAGVRLSWLHSGHGTPGAQLVAAVEAWTQPDGVGHAFVHGEAAAVKAIRRHLRVERGLPLEQLSISGYWRAGADDEKWRAIKRDWNREVDESERAAGVA
jgi:NADPH-dependent ferric siderophore reductase